MNSYIVPSTILIFDKIPSDNTEFKVFLDYPSSYKRKYEVVGVVSYA